MCIRDSPLPVVAIPVPDGARNARLDIKPHDLKGYDRLIHDTDTPSPKKGHEP